MHTIRVCHMSLHCTISLVYINNVTLPLAPRSGPQDIVSSEQRLDDPITNSSDPPAMLVISNGCELFLTKIFLQGLTQVPI